MRLKIQWNRSHFLKVGTVQSLIYPLDGENVPDATAVYEFERR